MSNLIVNVNHVLSFFDEDRSVSRHSNAIKTVAGEEFMFALLIEYFRQSDIASEVIDRKCTTGKPRGPRLDGWVKAQGKTEPEPIYYQVEVKLWSAHGVGSGAHFLKPSDDLATYRRKLWNTYWSKGRFTEAGLNKVLTPMACPIPNAKVKPLACLWSPVHPDGFEAPFFEQRLEPPEPFPMVSVFSASSFLRSIKDKTPTLALHLPEVKERMQWLNTFFVTP
jgi:hypothetical protein